MRKNPIIIATFARVSIAIPITGGFNEFIYPLWILLYFSTVIFVYIIAGLIREMGSGFARTSQPTGSEP
jgi:hypothetical protein